MFKFYEFEVGDHFIVTKPYSNTGFVVGEEYQVTGFNGNVRTTIQAQNLNGLQYITSDHVAPVMKDEQVEAYKEMLKDEIALADDAAAFLKESDDDTFNIMNFKVYRILKVALDD